MIFLVRHGERADADGVTPEETAKITIPCDVHLTDVGYQQAKKTGFQLKETIEQLKSDGKVDQDVQVTFVSSPLYRCIKTTRGMMEGSEISPKDNTIYVETGIEEYFNSICNGVDENWRSIMRYYNREQHPDFVAELFSDLETKHNTLFDYESKSELTANFPETYETAYVRFKSVFNSLGDKFTSGVLDQRKNIIVLCSHGISMEVLYNNDFQLKEYPCFCSFNLIETAEKQEDGNYKLVPAFLNRQTW